MFTQLQLLNDALGKSLMTTSNKMPKNDISTQDTLRTRAEASFKENVDLALPENLSKDAVNKLLHELQVHQIELEMQNEELRESHHALDIIRTRYFDLYDLAPIGYLTLNQHGIIQQANLTVADMLGLVRSTLIKKPLTKLILKDDQDVFYLNHKQLINSGDPQSFDLRIINNGDTPLWVNCVITLAENLDAEPEIRVVISDIGARKHAEQALNTAMNLANKANLAKSEFLSSMSHELRTPLNAILGFAQLIESSNPPPTFKQNRSIDQIIKAGWYLLALINEILDLAAIDAGKFSLTLETLSLAEVLSDSLAMLENQAQQRDISLFFKPDDVPYFIQADRVRVKQVFVNLLSNAIKYNNNSGSVTVRCTLKAKDRIRICIEDTGEGISAENMAQLFQPFNRLGKESSAQEGTGIGLVVTKRIVELMGGAIGVESTVGQGSIFWVELNLTDAPA